ncbi:hypothetical protein BH23GEM10_BH23GEM10_02430 [soil metagenome]
MTIAPEDVDSHSIVGALTAIEQQLAGLFGSSPDPIFAFDADGRLVSGNAALEHLTGFTLRELLGRPFPDILIPDDRARAYRHLARAARGEAQNLEVTGTGRDGRDFTIAMTINPMRVDNMIEGVYGIARDLTHQKETERALREAEERYGLLAGNVHDMISLHDPTGVFIYASPSAYALLGMHPVELIGRSVYDLIEPDDVAAVVTAHETIMRREGRQPATFRARRADGSIGWFESTARMITRDDSDEPWRIVAVTRDVTERREFESQIMQAHKMEALGTLAGGIAHDFSNVLTVIGGHAELLTAALSDRPKERANAEHIREAAQRGSALTRQLLSFGRGRPRDMRITDLNALILELQPMLSRLIGDDIELHLDLDPDLAGVRCEPSELEQIVVNLAANARDAMAAGGRLSLRTQNATIDESALIELEPGPYVLLTVADTGTGIEPDIVARVFEPFFTTKADGAGTGLGLSTVYTITTQAGGRVEIESTPGVGTQFSLHLPGHAGPADVTPDGRHAPAAALRGTETVMVAEDDAGVRALVVAALERYGYRVMTAVDGMQALELFHTYGHLIDIVVTDVNMPELKGPELVRILTDEGTTLPVLYMSGYTAESLALDELAPRRAFLAKPFTPVELAQAVRMLLGPVSAPPADEPA